MAEASPRARWTGWIPPLLGACGGGLLALSGEPWSINVAGFLSVSVLIEALARSEGRPRRILHGALVGLGFGTAVNAVALYSVVSLLVAFGNFHPVLAWLTATLCWTAQGLPYVVACALTEACVARGLPRWLAAPPALAACLALVPQLFPWHLGAPQVDFLHYVQMLDVGGEPLLDLSVAFVGASVYQLVRSAGRARLRPLVVGAFFLLAPLLYGLVRLDAIRAARAAAPSLRLGVVQGNVGIERKGDDARAREILDDLLRMTRNLEAQGAEVTVWAETAYPYRMLRARRTQYPDERRVVGRGVRGPVLLGAVTYAPFRDTTLRYNSAWLVQRDGSLGDRVDKSRLLAFGEYVPFWDWLPPLQERFPSRGFQEGVNDIIRTERGALGILICYEDLFFRLARQVAELGAGALVNMTNDAWFGDSHEPILHDMVARLRAIETRRDFVRAVNTGVSSFSLATGELIERTRTFERTSFIAEVKMLSLRTPYMITGDWVSPLCLVGLLGALVRRRLKVRA